MNVARWLAHPDDPAVQAEIASVLTIADKEWLRWHLGLAGVLFGQLRVPMVNLGQVPDWQRTGGE